MEKRIQEDQTMLWKLVWIYASVPLALLLAIMFLSKEVLFSFAFGLLIVCFVGFFHLRALYWPKPRPTWFVIESGLKCVDTDGKHETIRWDQIRLMKWVPLIGLLIQWKSPEAFNTTSSDMLRASLSVSEKKAREIMSDWKDYGKTSS